MNLYYTVSQFLKATNCHNWLTYEEYSRELVKDGILPISINQWNYIVSQAAGRHLQDPAVVNNIITNMQDLDPSSKNTEQTHKIEAVQWKGTNQSLDQIMAMGHFQLEIGEIGTETLVITTSRGKNVVHLTDWIVKGHLEFFSCRDEIFKEWRYLESLSHSNQQEPEKNTMTEAGEKSPMA